MAIEVTNSTNTFSMFKVSVVHTQPPFILLVTWLLGSDGEVFTNNALLCLTKEKEKTCNFIF